MIYDIAIYLPPKQHKIIRSIENEETQSKRRDYMQEVPVWEKANLSLNEAAAYFNIGVNKLRDMTDGDNCNFVLWNGNKRLIKRKLFEAYLSSEYSI